MLNDSSETDSLSREVAEKIICHPQSNLNDVHLALLQPQLKKARNGWFFVLPLSDPHIGSFVYLTAHA